MEQTYTFDGKKISFDLAEYLKLSKNILRKDMPQLNMEYLLEMIPMFKEFVSVTKIELAVSQLKPTQGEINMDKVVMNIAKQTPIDVTYICSNDLHIMDGHHRHVHMLMLDPTTTVTCYVFDIGVDELISLFRSFSEVLTPSKDISEQNSVRTILENYGMQGPGAAPGIGAVDFGQPKTPESAGSPGSGDMPGGVKLSKQKRDNEEDEEDETKVPENLLELLQTVGIQYKVDESKSVVRFQTMDGNWESWTSIDEAIKQAKTPTNNKPLKLHFAKTEDEKILPKLTQCVNLPIIRKCAKIEDAFSCETMEGITHGKAGDYLMIGVDGELYPCDSDIFHKTYQIVGTEEDIRTDENGVAILQTDISEMLQVKNN